MLTRTGLRTHSEQFATLVGDGSFTDRQGTGIAVEDGVEILLKTLCAVRERQGTVYLVGNGGSAAVASHAATDFFNTGGMRALTLHDPSTLTCFSNDYGYENAFSARLARLLTPQDLLIAISSSGRSQNILNAAGSAHAISAGLITLTGFAVDNPLRKMGDANYWLDSDAYGMVEIGHLFLLHYVADLLSMDWGVVNGK
jgi:D-sedoheptulose 7-phosphate isomerase